MEGARFSKPTKLFSDIHAFPTGLCSNAQLYRDVRDDKCMVQRLSLLKSLPVHRGCVNSICWNESGEFILSGSDDRHLVITNGHNYKVVEKIHTSLRSNIFSARFLPRSGDTRLVSCSGDGCVLFTDLEKKEETSGCMFSCHQSTAYELAVSPEEPTTFFSCGEDGTVRWFDLRVKSSCNKPDCYDDVLIDCRAAASALSLDPISGRYLAVGTGDSCVRLYDRRCLATRRSGGTGSGMTAVVAKFSSDIGGGSSDKRRHRVTSLAYSPNGSQLLASFWSDDVYLISTKEFQGGGAEEASASGVAREEAGEDGERLRDVPIKRLRLRGDWSDTGPNARPEAEGEETRQLPRSSLHTAMMRNMTSIIGRMLTSPFHTRLIQRRLGRTGPGTGEAGVGPGSGSADSNSSNLPAHTESLTGEGFGRSGLTAAAPISSEESVHGQNGEADDRERMRDPANRLYPEQAPPEPQAESQQNYQQEIPIMKRLKEYSGHRNARTMIKEACFWGSNYIMSGSDCGHVFVWDRNTCQQVMMLEADKHVVNCIQPHPSLPIFASSGIDYDVKLWAPIGSEPYFDEARAERLRERNKIMLAETKDTVTIPVSFMIRMLTSLHSLDRDEHSSDGQESSSSSSMADE